MTPSSPLTVDFAGERIELDGSGPFAVGREGGLAIPDNPYLHRRFIELRTEVDLWWLINVGSQLSATISVPSSGVHAWLAPGGRMPLVFGTTTVRFSAGPAVYEIVLTLHCSPYEIEASARMSSDGTTTVGRMRFTRDQRLMILALAESALLRGVAGMADIPSAAAAAQRLGWTQKKFEKKVDNVCDRLSQNGVRGLKGDMSNQAVSRRARLVEYALATGVVVVADLSLLDEPQSPSA